MVEENKFIFSISFDPLTKLEMKPNDYLFTIKDEIVTTREKTINQAILDQLREIGRARNCSTLIAIDEEKLMDLVRKAEIFDILCQKLRFDTAKQYPDNTPIMSLWLNDYCKFGNFQVTDEIYCFLMKWAATHTYQHDIHLGNK